MIHDEEGRRKVSTDFRAAIVDFDDGMLLTEDGQIYRTIDRKKRVTYVEVFTWINSEAPEICHRTPAVMQIWEPMGALAEDMEFLSTDD